MISKEKLWLWLARACVLPIAIAPWLQLDLARTIAVELISLTLAFGCTAMVIKTRGYGYVPR